MLSVETWWLLSGATVAPTRPAGVLGESLPSSVGAALGALVKTGANLGPLLLALPLLLLGLGLVALSRPRRRWRRHAGCNSPQLARPPLR